MKFTTEQQELFDYFNESDSNENVKIIAYAGTGKSFCLKEIAHILKDKRILNLSFNKKIMLEARKTFPRNVDCSTFHGFAYRKMNPTLIDSPKEFVTYLSKLLDVKIWDAWIVYRVIENFCQNGEAKILPIHSHTEKLVEKYGKKLKKDKIDKKFSDLAQRFWDAYENDPNIPVPHFCYLKKFSLLPEIPVQQYDVVLVDEAQDSNPTMISILNKIDQRVIIVGDPFQQIYSFTGAINALDKFDYKEFHLSKSFRWGEKIADISNMILNFVDNFDKRFPVRGVEERNSHILYGTNVLDCQRDAILCRTNLSCFMTGVELWHNDIPYYISDAEQILEQYNKILAIKNSKGKKLPYAGCWGWDQLVDYVMSTDCELPTAWIVAVIYNSKGHLLEQFLKRSDRNGVAISTAHKAKGLEWETVFVSDDFFENEKTVCEEEFRLFYVACTRAKSYLCLNFSENKLMGILEKSKSIIKSRKKVDKQK